jgi:translation elongation factor EF-Tu-like GTPase
MSLRFVVRDVFPLAEGGAVVAGRVEAGAVREGQPVSFTSRFGRPVQACVVTIERAADRVLVPQARAGEEVRLLLPEVSPAALAAGTVLREIPD